MGGQSEAVQRIGIERWWIGPEKRVASIWRLPSVRLRYCGDIGHAAMRSRPLGANPDFILQLR